MRIKSIPQLLIGGLILFIGVGFLLDALNVWNFSNFFTDWWPAIIIIIGLASLLTNPTAPLWPLFVMGVGLLLLLRSLDTVTFNVWQVIWPIGLIIFGLTFFFHQLLPKPRTYQEDRVDIFVIFSGSEVNNKSRNFLGGKLTAIFGGIKLDLTEATIKNKASLDIFTMFGGVELHVPSKCIVQTSGLPIIGGWDDKTTKPKDEKSPAIIVRGTSLFGGVEIKN